MPSKPKTDVRPLSETTYQLDTLVAHPLAELLPAMSFDDFQELQKDVIANGVRVPIVMADGKILDGRHRVNALLMADNWQASAPIQEVGAKTSLSDAVIAMNISRRHLRPKQRAQLVLDILRADGREPSVRQLATEAGVGAGTAQRAIAGDKEPTPTSGNLTADVPDDAAEELIVALQTQIDELEERISMMLEASVATDAAKEALDAFTALQAERGSWKARAVKAEAHVKHVTRREKLLRKTLRDLRENDGIGSVEEVRKIVDPVLAQVSRS